MTQPFVDVTRTARQRFDAVSWLTLYLILLVAIPSQLVFRSLGSAGAPSMLVGLISLGLWLLLRGGNTVPRVTPIQPVRIALAGFLLCVGVSYALAMTRPISWDEVSPADVALLSLLSWSGTLLFAHDEIATRHRLETFVWRLALAGGLLAVLGLAQFVTTQPLVDRISVPGLTPISSAALAIRNGLPRPSGTATHAIEFGTLLCLLLPMAMHVAFHNRHLKPVVRWWPTLAIAAVIVISNSRSAYVSVVVAVLVSMVGWTAKQRRVIIGLTLGGIAVLAVATPRILNTIAGLFAGADEDPSIASRTDSWEFAWAFFLQHPLFGKGLGTFLPKYRIFDNQYLLLLVSVGAIGTIAFTSLAVVAISRLVRLFRTMHEPREKDLAMAFVAALASGFVSLAFFDAFAFPMTMGGLCVVLGTGAAYNRLMIEGDRSDPDRWPGRSVLAPRKPRSARRRDAHAL